VSISEIVKLPSVVEKPWGSELWWALTDQYAGKIISVKAGHKLSIQYHERKDETSYLMSGRMLLYKGTCVEDLTCTEIGPGHQWRNLPGEVHTIEALEDAEVLEVSTPHLDDVVRLQDAYGREGTSAP
jgi:mannose-6-phosphate isomerase-like protein (cupin superfamily)